jgi:hypothetical protein
MSLLLRCFSKSAKRRQSETTAKRPETSCGVVESCFAPSHSLHSYHGDGALGQTAELDARNSRCIPWVMLMDEINAISVQPTSAPLAPIVSGRASYFLGVSRGSSGVRLMVDTYLELPIFLPFNDYRRSHAILPVEDEGSFRISEC